MTWFQGANRQERLAAALERHSLDALLSLEPENSEYLSSRYNYIATHWRVPGLFSAVANRSGDVAVVTGDFGVDPSVPASDRHLTFPIWTESADVRGFDGENIAARVMSSRAESLNRPAQFDLEQVFDRVAAAIRTVAGDRARVGLELGVLPASAVERLRARLPQVDFIEAGTLFDDLRALKDPDEIAKLRLASGLTEIGIAGAISRLRPGLNTAAVNSLYQIAVHEAVMSDPRFAAFRQAEGAAGVGLGIESTGVVASGQTVKFDMQVDIGGYHSDVGRTVAFEPTPNQIAVYGALRAALAEAQEAMRPGATFAEVHAAGTRAMVAAGFANYSRGHLGHSLGLTQNFEEPPFIAPDEPRPMVPGMVLSLELPYYLYGVGAFQLERMILITESGHEAIDRLPFQLAIDA
jgi:Xaa-Pro dipeptidase